MNHLSFVLTVKTNLFGDFRKEEDFYADSKSLAYGTHKPSREAVDKMVGDLEKQCVENFLFMFSF